MKIVQISDIHLHSGMIAGNDPAALFVACMNHIEAHHRDANTIIITGDLTHIGDETSYLRLHEFLKSYPLPVNLMIGNHDKRDVFQSVFSQAPRDDDGFVQYSFDTSGFRCVCLDTVEAGSHSGHLCPARHAWLANELDKARFDERQVLLFMHHHPVAVGVWSADVVGLKEPEIFEETLQANRDNIRHLFFGHCHYTVSGSFCGIPFSAPRSISHPCWPEFTGKWAMGVGPLAPSYSVALINNNSVVVHAIEFLAESEIIYIPAGEETSRIPPS